MNAEPHLESLKIKHADLDAKIAAKSADPTPTTTSSTTSKSKSSA
jgi:hypothetical protein